MERGLKDCHFLQFRFQEFEATFIVEVWNQRTASKGAFLTVDLPLFLL